MISVFDQYSETGAESDLSYILIAFFIMKLKLNAVVGSIITVSAAMCNSEIKSVETPMYGSI